MSEFAMQCKEAAENMFDFNLYEEELSQFEHEQQVLKDISDKLYNLSKQMGSPISINVNPHHKTRFLYIMDQQDSMTLNDGDHHITLVKKDKSA